MAKQLKGMYTFLMTSSFRSIFKYLFTFGGADDSAVQLHLTKVAGNHFSTVCRQELSRVSFI